MKKGEISILRCMPAYGYGNKTVGQFPANSVVSFEIELLDWEEYIDSNSSMMDGDNFHEIVLYVAMGVFAFVLLYYWIRERRH
jgi:hypothetical protein